MALQKRKMTYPAGWKRTGHSLNQPMVRFHDYLHGLQLGLTCLMVYFYELLILLIFVRGISFLFLSFTCMSAAVDSILPLVKHRLIPEVGSYGFQVFWISPSISLD